MALRLTLGVYSLSTKDPQREYMSIVVCLSQSACSMHMSYRLSHACLSISFDTTKLRMSHQSNHSLFGPEASSCVASHNTRGCDYQFLKPCYYGRPSRLPPVASQCFPRHQELVPPKLKFVKSGCSNGFAENSTIVLIQIT